MRCGSSSSFCLCLHTVSLSHACILGTTSVSVLQNNRANSSATAVQVRCEYPSACVPFAGFEDLPSSILGILTAIRISVIARRRESTRKAEPRENKIWPGRSKSKCQGRKSDDRVQAEPDRSNSVCPDILCARGHGAQEAQGAFLLSQLPS